MANRRVPRVFISYSHDSARHQERVLDLADRLRADGIDAEIDQYNPAPPEGWPLWCERQIAGADVVLMVCTETYRRRVMGEEEPRRGLGVVWEARIIRQLLYDAGAVSDKVVPVLFSDGSPEHIPTPVKAWSRYVADTGDGYEALYRRLTGQPLTPRPELGEIRALPPRPRQWSVDGAEAVWPPGLGSTGEGSGSDEEMGMGENTRGHQSGGVNISGWVGSVSGDIVGRDKIVGAPSAAALEDALRPLAEAIGAAPAEAQAQAEAKLAALKEEAAKGKDANDGVMAKIVDGLVGLVPGAASAVVSAFGTPMLGGIAGPVTSFVLDKLRLK